jgi:hypothetical protein
MGELEFVLHGAAFRVDSLAARQVCEVLAQDPPLEQHVIQSNVSSDIFRLFISAMEGESIELTNDNIEGLSALSDEFQFRRLSQSVRAFKDAPSYRIGRLEERIAALEAGVLTLQSFQQSAGKVQKEAISTLESVVQSLKIGMDSQILSDIDSRRMESVIVSEFPTIFEEFGGKGFSLLWRGSRDGFDAGDFHRRCDGHANNVTVILDMKGNIFGGFTPLKWESCTEAKHQADRNLKSFLFTLKNPHNIGPRKFALKSNKQDEAIECVSCSGPHFGDIGVSDHCNTVSSYTFAFGVRYTNNTGLHGMTFFTGSQLFNVKEIEVFQIID